MNAEGHTYLLVAGAALMCLHSSPKSNMNPFIDAGIGPMLGKYILCSWLSHQYISCDEFNHLYLNTMGQSKFTKMYFGQVLTCIGPLLAQYLYVCWDLSMHSSVIEDLFNTTKSHTLQKDHK